MMQGMRQELSILILISGLDKIPNGKGHVEIQIGIIIN